jgi:hypothetical protein
MHDVNAHLSDEQLSLFLDDRLDASEAGAINRHMQACAECNHSLVELTATVQALRALPAPPLPRSFLIEQPPKVSLWSRLFGSTVALQGLATAAAALFVVLLSADMWTSSPTAGIVPLLQPTPVAPGQGLQSTALPYTQPAAAGRASQAAPAAAPPAAPAGAAQVTSEGATVNVDTAANMSASDRSENAPLRSENAPLESLTAKNGSAAAAGPVPRLSVVTVTTGIVAVLLIIAAVARTVRRT